MVSSFYTGALQRGSCGCGCGPAPSKSALPAGYQPDELDLLPDGESSFGCGNPLAFAAVKEGETVLDLGACRALGLLQEAQVRGDFLVPDPTRVHRLLARLPGLGAQAAADLAAEADLPDDLRATLARLLLESAPPGESA